MAVAGELGILSIVDGAHAPGQLDIDLPAIGADFFTGNCHKWLMAPKGAGFLYVRPECQDLIEPLIVSWGYKNDLTHSRSKFLDYLVWSGTDDPAAYLAVPDAIQYQESHDWRGIRMSCHEILGHAIEQICTLSGLGNPYGNNSTLYHQMGIAPLPHIRDLNALKACLYDDYHIEVPLIEWNQQHFIRISVQGYNSQDDIVALIQALEKLLPEYSD